MSGEDEDKLWAVSNTQKTSNLWLWHRTDLNQTTGMQNNVPGGLKSKPKREKYHKSMRG